MIIEERVFEGVVTIDAITSYPAWSWNISALSRYCIVEISTDLWDDNTKHSYRYYSMGLTNVNASMSSWLTVVVTNDNLFTEGESQPTVPAFDTATGILSQRIDCLTNFNTRDSIFKAVVKLIQF